MLLDFQAISNTNSMAFGGDGADATAGAGSASSTSYHN
jgi:hypothetical protein